MFSKNKSVNQKTILKKKSEYNVKFTERRNYEENTHFGILLTRQNVWVGETLSTISW